MNVLSVGTGTGGAFPSSGGRGAARYLADGLRLAAAPTFLAMALLAGLPGDGGGAAALLCLSADHGSLFSGMVSMYVLMATFHLPPWLKLLFSRRGGAAEGGDEPAVGEGRGTFPNRRLDVV